MSIGSGPLLTLSVLLASSGSALGQADTTLAAPQTPTPPKTWIDADTGHRVIRLTDEANSEALFNYQNAFTPHGLDMVYAAPGAIRVLNLATLKSKLVVCGNVHNPVVGTKTRRVFYRSEQTANLYVADIDTGEVAQLPQIPVRGVIESVDADETLLVERIIEGTARDFAYYKGQASQEASAEILKKPTPGLDSREIRADATQRAKQLRADAKVPEDIFTVNLQTGEVRTILKGTDWLNKVRFSPTDPNLILYEHEGPWSDTTIDRIWTIRADGSQAQKVHERAIPEDLGQREFWGRDGKTIWYELQKPSSDPTSPDHALVGYDLATGKRRYFHIDPLQFSVNYNAAGNDSMICGSGRRSKTTHGNTPPTYDQILDSGEWIEVLYPIYNNADVGADTQNTHWFHFNNQTSDPGSDVKYAGWFRREKLVNMFNNDYTKHEPDVRFSPDNKFVIFTSNMFGPTYVFAAEVN